MKARILTKKSVNFFFFFNWYFYHIICKTIETSTLNVYKTTFPSRELSGLSRNGSHMKGM